MKSGDKISNVGPDELAAGIVRIKHYISKVRGNGAEAPLVHWTWKADYLLDERSHVDLSCMPVHVLVLGRVAVGRAHSKSLSLARLHHRACYLGRPSLTVKRPTDQNTINWDTCHLSAHRKHLTPIS